MLFFGFTGTSFPNTSRVREQISMNKSSAPQNIQAFITTKKVSGIDTMVPTKPSMITPAIGNRMYEDFPQEPHRTGNIHDDRSLAQRDIAGIWQ